MVHLSYYQIGKIAVTLFKKGFKKPLYLINQNKSLLSLPPAVIQPSSAEFPALPSPPICSVSKSKLKQFTTMVDKHLNSSTSSQTCVTTIVKPVQDALSQLSQTVQKVLSPMAPDILLPKLPELPKIIPQPIPCPSSVQSPVQVTKSFIQQKPTLQTCRLPTIQDFLKQPLYITMQYPITLTIDEMCKLSLAMHYEFYCQKSQISCEQSNVSDLLLSSYDYYISQYDMLKECPIFKKISSVQQSGFLTTALHACFGPERKYYDIEFVGGYIFVNYLESKI